MKKQQKKNIKIQALNITTKNKQNVNLEKCEHALRTEK